MDYIEKAKKIIREEWFVDHEIQSIKGDEGFKEIIFGKTGDYINIIKYTFTGNVLLVSGDLGISVFKLNELAKIETLTKYNLIYFSQKWEGGNIEKFVFDSSLASKDIKEYLFQTKYVDSVYELNENDRALYYSLIEEAKYCILPQHFKMAVYHVYKSTDLEWFDSEVASDIENLGQRLSYNIISYWVGLQMISELLEENNY